MRCAGTPAEACPRLDGLPGRDLPGGLRVAEADTRAARILEKRRWLLARKNGP